MVKTDKYAAVPVAAAFLLLNLFSPLSASLTQVFKSIFGGAASVVLIGVIGGAMIVLPALYIIYNFDCSLNYTFKPVTSKYFFIVLGLACSAFTVFVSQMTSIISKNPSTQDVLGSGAKNAAPVFAVYIAFSLIPALCEELLLRKAVLSVLLKNFGGLPSILISATYFALLHGSVKSFIAPFAVGLILSWVVAVSGRLWPAILIHVMVNTYSFYFETALLSSGSSDSKLIFTIFNLFVLLICASLSLRFYEKKHDGFFTTKLKTLKETFALLPSQRVSSAALFLVLCVYIIKNISIK